MLIYFLSLCFVIKVSLIYNVSGVQQSDPVIYIYIYIYIYVCISVSFPV